MTARSVDYAALHRDSPVARAVDVVGPVRVTDSLRADIAHRVSRRDLARAYGLGVCSATAGLAADQHQHASGLWPELTPADYLAEWITTACQWHTTGGSRVSDAVDPDGADVHAASRLARLDQQAAELEAVAPAWFTDWACRLVHPPKWEYLIELGGHQWLGEPVPVRPDHEWASKMDGQWARRIRSGEHVDAVVRALEPVEQF